MSRATQFEKLSERDIKVKQKLKKLYGIDDDVYLFDYIYTLIRGEIRIEKLASISWDEI